MNDKLLLENMLLLLKSTTEVYVHGTLESVNKTIHNALKHGLEETLKLQDELYTEMTNCGWYTIKNVDSKQITQALNKLESK